MSNSIIDVIKAINKDKCFACGGKGETQFLYMELDYERRHELYEAAQAGKEALDDFILIHSKLRKQPCWHCRHERNNNHEEKQHRNI